MITTIWSGLAVGAVYRSFAYGYNVGWVCSGVLNFANANIMMLGAFIGWWAMNVLRGRSR